jgi:hypothetical protein
MSCISDDQIRWRAVPAAGSTVNHHIKPTSLFFDDQSDFAGRLSLLLREAFGDSRNLVAS